MLASGRVIVAATGLALALAGCTEASDEALPSANSTVTPTATESAWIDPAGIPLDGTTLVDPTSARHVSGRDGAMAELAMTIQTAGAYDVIVALGPGGRELIERIPADPMDGDVIVKPSEYAWFDGTFHPLGSTADLVVGDGARQNFSEWTDGESTTWVESPSIQALPSPWRLFAAGPEGSPTLIATSEDAGDSTDFPSVPKPVIFDGRVYWDTVAPPGTVTGVATWSSPVGGGTPRMELVGARNLAATDEGVFAIAELWGPEGADGLEPGAVRIARVDGPEANTTLRTLDVGANGSASQLLGEGRWLAADYDMGFQSGGIAVFSAGTGEGFSIAPVDGPHGAGTVLCDAALVWIVPGEDWLTDTIYRLDLDTGDLISIDAPRAFYVGDCEGNDVLWSQSNGDGTVKQYITTVD